MKKLFSIISLGLILWVLSCAAGATRSYAKEIALIWATKSTVTSNTAIGFRAGMRQLAPDLKVTDYRERKNMEEAIQVFHECESKVDGIVFLRSPGAEYLAKITPKIPCFIGGCNNPAEIGVIKNLSAPEGMVTGVTYFIPYDKRFSIIKSMFPGIKSVGLLAEKGHPSGVIEAAGTRKECQRLGISYKEAVVSNLDELVQETGNLAGNVDLLIVTNSNLLLDHMTNLLPITNTTKTPWFSYADHPVKAGAVAGIAADDVKLGGMLAESVVDVLVRNKPISQVPVKMDPEPKVTINEGMMRSLGLHFPEAILKGATILR